MNDLSLLSKIKKQNTCKWLIFVLVFVFIVVIIYGTVNILADNKYADGNIYKAIGFIILMVWTCIFLCYFVWALYFYNYNLGLTAVEWQKIYEAKDNRTKGLPYSQQDIDDEPQYNPYKDETFGLPPGTVRGMIAFTLLFGAIALLLVSFGVNNELKAGSFFYDQFEFFKTAFLMMIAFYFGSRSLQYLKSGNLVKTGDNSQNNAGQPTTKVQTPTPQPEIVVVGNENPVVPEGEIPPIVAIDPMNPQK